jgi:hypothetical protein
MRRKTMRAETFQICTDAENAQTGGGTQLQEPFLRLSNCGCGLPHCNCSPERFVSVSDGQVGITLVLTPDEFEVIRQAFRLPQVWVNLVAEKTVPR